MIEPCEEVKRVEQRYKKALDEVEQRYEKALDEMEKHYKDVLERIRREIEDLYIITNPASDPYDGGYYTALIDVRRIIDKYLKGEQG